MTSLDGILAAMAGDSLPDGAARRAAVEAYQARGEQLNLEMRELLVAWSPVICSCTPTFTRARVSLSSPPPHADCIVHGQFMITDDGRVL